MRNSEIIICNNIKLEKGYKDVLDYTEAQMVTLCRNNQVASSNKYSFIRSERNTIKTSFSYSDALKCNYMAFQNSDYSNKWFFAFIDDVIYANDGTCKIVYTIDEFSTWWDYWSPSPCFVIREHVNDDTVGLHTVPEGLETGDYVINQSDYYSGLDTLKYIIQCTEWSSGDNKPLATNYGGVYMSGGAYICSSISEVVNILALFAQSARSDAVYNLYMCPASIINNTSDTLQYSGQSEPVSINYSVSKPSDVNGYIPKNNKVRCFPYMYLEMSNNNGVSNILHYERFSTNNCSFNIKGVPVVGSSIKCNPKNYDVMLENEIEGIIGGKFPTLNWSNDEYVNWLTQNAVNIMGMELNAYQSQLAGAGLQATVGTIQALSGDVTGGLNIGSGISSLFSAVQENYRHSLVPNSSRGNVNGGDINVCSNKNGFFFNHYSIKQEYAKIIDDWFTKFGYKINRIKLPNQTGRENWNFIQIGSSENIGYSVNNTQCVPAKSMDIINTIYRNGVTIWHSHANLGNYNLTNNIIN